MDDRRPGYRALEAGMVAYARVDAGARRVLEAVRRGLGAMLAESMSADELRALSVRLYGTLLAPASARQGLFDWEERWFAARLPPPPARLLVGGAGAGREVAPLVARGYLVDALEPAPELAAALAACGAASATVASHEDLAAAVLDGAVDAPAAVVARQRYAAVLLGWGSLTHVMRAEDRARVIVACARLTDGPVLASFWMKDQAATSDASGRAAAVGRRVGRALGRWRGAPAPGEPFAFGHAFERAEVEALAAAAGRRVAWDAGAGEYPHVTFLP